MKVVTLPLDIVCGDSAENLIAVEELLKTIDKDTDIVVLPELFSTGFLSNAELIGTISETSSGHTIATLNRWATQYNLALCGSILIKIADKYYNRGFFIEPSGEETYRDKVHLFSLSEESKILTPGNEGIPVIRYRGWNISFIICYDLRFPVWCRNTDCRYDIMLVPANWPTTRKHAWETLIKARAIENQSYYVASNRTGRDDFGEYSPEMSFIADYKGNICSSTLNGITVATLNKESLDEFRQKFPVWKDSDHFEIRN